MDLLVQTRMKRMWRNIFLKIAEVTVRHRSGDLRQLM